MIYYVELVQNAVTVSQFFSLVYYKILCNVKASGSKYRKCSTIL